MLNACVVSDTIVIADSSLKIDSFNVQSISCFNGNDAVIEISVIGGVPNIHICGLHLIQLKLLTVLVKDGIM